MNQIQCAMIVSFKNDAVAFTKKLRNHRNKKKKIERTTRSYRTLKYRQTL